MDDGVDDVVPHELLSARSRWSVTWHRLSHATWWSYGTGRRLDR